MFSQHIATSSQNLSAAPEPQQAFQHLHRLSQRPGVQSTLILSRATGAIVHSTGLPTVKDQKIPSNVESGSAVVLSADISQRPLENYRRHGDGSANRNVESSVKMAGEIAESVMKLFEATGHFAKNIGDDPRDRDHDEDDAIGPQEEEIRLLRLRLRRREVVVVPDSQFILIVIHEPRTN